MPCLCVRGMRLLLLAPHPARRGGGGLDVDILCFRRMHTCRLSTHLPAACVCVCVCVFVCVSVSVCVCVCAASFPESVVVERKVWNWIVANLALMALGTSAPEILLS